MAMLTGIRLLIFATLALASATWMCYDIYIDGNQFIVCFGAVMALVGGKEYITYKNLQNGGQ